MTSGIPLGGADARIVWVASHGPKECGHKVPWDQDCPACASVWREDRVKDLHKQAAKYGFKLVPDDQ